jgi:hypothetical protein
LRASKGAEPKLSDEHISYRWATPSAARAAVHWKAHRDALDLAVKAIGHQTK